MSDVACPLVESRVWHPAHTWHPLVADPESPRALHIFTSPETGLACPGWRDRSTGSGRA